MIVSKEITLDTSKGSGVFTVPQLDGVRAMKLFVRLANKVGPALSNRQAGNGAAMIAGLLEKVDPEEYERIQNEVLSRVSVRFPDANEVDANAARNLGEIFTGHPFELGRLVLFALECNFGSFFERLRTAVSGALNSKTAA